MQCYAAVLDNSNYVLVGKKRFSNNYWGGQLTPGGNGQVNAAGQYCLPGGGSNNNEPYEVAAAREFLEETGFLLAPHLATFIDKYESEEGWALCVFKVASVEQIALQINGNISAGHPVGHPSSPNVRDWELQRVLAVRRSNLSQFLGVFSTLPPEATPAIPDRRNSIDWYSQMAAHLRYL